MKLTNDLKFRFVDNNSLKEEIKNLTPEDWKKLYSYQKRRDKEICKQCVNFTSILIKYMIIFFGSLFGLAILVALSNYFFG